MSERERRAADIRIARLRLYIARSTPNSARAEQNLRAALSDMANQAGSLELELVDVFTYPKRAIIDGVIVTPTLISIGPNGRMMMIGDLGDGAKLKLFLRSQWDANGGNTQTVSL